MRTVLSALQVATKGRRGCGAVSQVRSREGGVSGDRRVMVPEGLVGIFFFFKGVFALVVRGKREVVRRRWVRRAESVCYLHRGL